MSSQPLARVLDTAALDRPLGPTARLSIQVPGDWITTGASLVITAPKRLTCGRCDGGGCDACQRTGVVPAPERALDRTVRVHVAPCDQGAIALRLSQPFGPEGPVDQLVLEVRSADSPSTCVTREALAVVPSPSPRIWAVVAGLAVALATLIAILLR